jgi:hypothetical protein
MVPLNKGQIETTNAGAMLQYLAEQPSGSRCRDTIARPGQGDRMEKSYQRIISINPNIRGGKPIVRGLRYSVYDILSYLAAGMSTADTKSRSGVASCCVMRDA